jgi:uncharacterized repeat protein (TIGR01451 family)
MSRLGRWFAVTLPLVVGAGVALSSTAFAGGATVRDTVYPKGADLAVSIETSPYSVTAGNDASFDVTVTDRGTLPAHLVTLTNDLPAGQTFVAALPSQGSCTEVGGTVVCALGDLPVLAKATVHVIIQTSTTPSVLADTARVHGSPNDPVKTNNHTTHYLGTYAPNQDEADGYIPPAGGSVSTGHSTGLLNPTSSNLHGPATPFGFPVSIFEYTPYSPSDGCAQGVSCFGQIVSVYDFVGVGALHPALLTMTFNHSQIPAGRSINTRLYDEGRIVPKCFAGAKGAQPDPCVASRTLLGSGNWRLVVRLTREGYFRL